MALTKWKDVNSAHKVIGPIRCHKCRLMCRDAEHYLSHVCDPRLRQFALRKFER